MEQQLDHTGEHQTQIGQLLIIDDEQAILSSLRRQFRRSYEVHLANSADEGYRIMREVPIHVIISDQRMPGMTGADFFAQMKTEFPDAIRLLLTGYADIQSVIDAINDGNVYRYITKPWDPEELNTIVRQAFERYFLTIQNRHLLVELREANAMLEQRVAERTAELAALNKQKDIFLGMAAHDLRGPLWNIQMAATLIRASKSKEEVTEYTHMIDETSGDMLRLVNDLLDIAAIESGNITLAVEEINLQRLIEKVCKLNHAWSDLKGIQLAIELDNGLSTVCCDPRRIEQVLNNLLGNAIKFSFGSTTVTVRAEQMKSHIVISVIDQGQGIRQEEQDRIFHAYQKSSTKPTGGEKSTGLGLSICRRIVELHNGQIGVESVYGQGSRFYFALPV